MAALTKIPPTLLRGPAYPECGTRMVLARIFLDRPGPDRRMSPGTPDCGWVAGQCDVHVPISGQLRGDRRPPSQSSDPRHDK